MLTYDGERTQWEGPDFFELRRQTVTAKKPHTCAWCKKPILTGSRYMRFVFLEDGQFRSEAVDFRCWGGGA